MVGPGIEDVYISYQKWGYSSQLCDRLTEGTSFFGGSGTRIED